MSVFVIWLDSSLVFTGAFLVVSLGQEGVWRHSKWRKYAVLLGITHLVGQCT